MVELRTGTYGKYYTTPMKAKSEYLSDDKQKINVNYIYSYLKDKGKWSTESIGAILGNMYVESKFNPGMIQGCRLISGNPLNHGGGISLVQWTKSSAKGAVNRYINWLNNNKSIPNKDYANIDNALNMLVIEASSSNSNWIPRKMCDKLTFKEFISNSRKLSVEELTKAFMLSYERPQDQSSNAQKNRANQGVKWYSYISRTSISTPSEPEPPPKPAPWIRTSMPENGNKYYITKGGGGYSSCCLGKPNYSPLNVLQNCVGAAWGAFNETYANTLRNTHFGPILDKEYYRPRGDARTIISGAKSVGLTTLLPSARPPIGGLVVWGGSLNHVAYISSVSSDGNSIVVQQSGYNSSSKWLWRSDTYTRNQNGKNHWGYISGGECLGFVVNPAISENYQPVTVPSDMPPSVNSIDSVSAKEIRINGVKNSILGITKRVVVYYKWGGGTDVSDTNNDGYVTVEEENFSVAVSKPRGATSVSVLPIQYNSSGEDIRGSVVTKGGLIESYPCFHIKTASAEMGEAIPYVYINGEWSVCTPIINLGGKRYAIYNTDYEKV